MEFRGGVEEEKGLPGELEIPWRPLAAAGRLHFGKRAEWKRALQLLRWPSGFCLSCS